MELSDLAAIGSEVGLASLFFVLVGTAFLIALVAGALVFLHRFTNASVSESAEGIARVLEAIPGRRQRDAIGGASAGLPSDRTAALRPIGDFAPALERPSHQEPTGTEPTNALGNDCDPLGTGVSIEGTRTRTGDIEDDSGD